MCRAAGDRKQRWLSRCWRHRWVSSAAPASSADQLVRERRLDEVGLGLRVGQRVGRKAGRQLALEARVGGGPVRMRTQPVAKRQVAVPLRVSRGVAVKVIDAGLTLHEEVLVRERRLAKVLVADGGQRPDILLAQWRSKSG